MTAVEFILKELGNHFEEEMQNLYLSDMQLVADICKQAKEMEKQQIIDAFKRGLINEMNGIEEITSKQYYNQQFKNK